MQEGEILAGKYRVERVLGAGGMGVVVAAIHQQLDQRVALKFLLPEGAANEETVGRFLREARAAVRLRSEHVAKVLDVGTVDAGSPYIVMEYLEGGDLAGVIEKQGQLSLDVAVTYVLQACEAVAEAHAHAIIHRDLKPANLFITRRADGSPCVKVLDFGISKVGGVDASMTKTNVLMGTPYYMAPELMRSSKLADARSDLWALGMILYEALSGRVAFHHETLPELCTAILFEPLPPIHRARPDLPPGVEIVLERALAKEPQHRYQDLAEFAAALAPYAPRGEDAARRVAKILGKEVGRSVAPPSQLETRVEGTPVAAQYVVERSSLHDASSTVVDAPPADSRYLGPPSPPMDRHGAAGAGRVLSGEDPSTTTVTPSLPLPKRRWPVGLALGAVVVVGAVVLMQLVRGSGQGSVTTTAVPGTTRETGESPAAAAPPPPAAPLVEAPSPAGPPAEAVAARSAMTPPSSPPPPRAVRKPPAAAPRPGNAPVPTDVIDFGARK